MSECPVGAHTKRKLKKNRQRSAHPYTLQPVRQVRRATSSSRQMVVESDGGHAHMHNMLPATCGPPLHPA